MANHTSPFCHALFRAEIGYSLRYCMHACPVMMGYLLMPAQDTPPHAGALFQWPGLLIAALAGAGVANFLKDPAPWLRGIIAGERPNLA